MTAHGKKLLIQFPCFRDERGCLSVADYEACGELPFEIRRVFWVYGVPGEARRGGHAHRTCEELLIAVSGSFEVEVFDGHGRQSFCLDDPSEGLHVPANVWCELKHFSEGAVCLVLASQEYDSGGYINNLEEFLTIDQSFINHQDIDY